MIDWKDGAGANLWTSTTIASKPLDVEQLYKGWINIMFHTESEEFKEAKWQEIKISLEQAQNKEDLKKLLKVEK